LQRMGLIVTLQKQNIYNYSLQLVQFPGAILSSRLPMQLVEIAATNRYVAKF